MTQNVSADVVKTTLTVIVRLECGNKDCRKFIGAPTGSSTVTCDHCGAVNMIHVR